MLPNLNPLTGPGSKQHWRVAYDDKGAATDTTGSSKGAEALGLPDDE